MFASGEGQGNVQIDAVNLQTGQVTSTQTWDSGGYEIALQPGQYQVIASVNGEVVKTVNLNVGSLNMEYDFNLSNPWQGGTPAAAIAALQPAPVAAVAVQPAPVVPTAPPPTVSLGPITPAVSQNASPDTLGMNWTTWNAGVS
jgi:hypothetical protein